MDSVLGKVTVPISLKDMAKLPPQRRQIKKALVLDDEPDYPLVIVLNLHIDKNEGLDPFLVFRVSNNFILHSFMLDFGFWQMSCH